MLLLFHHITTATIAFLSQVPGGGLASVLRHVRLVVDFRMFNFYKKKRKNTTRTISYPKRQQWSDLGCNLLLFREAGLSFRSVLYTRNSLLLSSQKSEILCHQKKLNCCFCESICTIHQKRKHLVHCPNYSNGTNSKYILNYSSNAAHYITGHYSTITEMSDTECHISTDVWHLHLLLIWCCMRSEFIFDGITDI